MPRHACFGTAKAGQTPIGVTMAKEDILEFPGVVKELRLMLALLV